MKILLPVDGSAYTERALNYVSSRVDLLGPENHEYVLLTVIPAVPPHPASFLGAGVLESYYSDEAEKILRPARAHIATQERTNWRVSSTHLHGHAADKIAQFATSGTFDLIVMGTHGHSALGNVVLGSVATGVLAKCKVPVLLIR